MRMKVCAILLIIVNLVFLQTISAFNYVKKEEFSSVIKARDKDSFISPDKRVLALSDLYSVYVNNEEVAVFNYYKNEKLIDESYILQTTTNNHWIQLVADGDEKISLKIKVKGLDLSDGMISLQGLECDASVENGYAIINIDKSNQRGMIIFDGNEEEPFFIFIDTPIDYTAENVVVFKGYNRGNYVLPQSINIVVLPLGSYYVGNIRSNHDFKVIGHGIISQEGILHSSYEEGDDNALKCNISSDNKAKMQINGITSIEPSLYQFWAWPCDGIKYEQVKCFGFQYESDSFIGQEIIDCFSKANDDHIKLYHSNIVVKNLTTYLQGNGNVFQFGWGNYGSRENIDIDGVILLRDLNKSNLAHVRSFINWRKPDYDINIGSVHINNIKAFDEVKLFLSIVQNQPVSTPSLSDFKIENVELLKGIKYPFQIIGNDKLQVEISNLEIKGKKIMKEDLSSYINQMSTGKIHLME